MKEESSGDGKRKERIGILQSHLGQLSEQVDALTDFDARKQKYNSLSQEIEFYDKYRQSLKTEEKKDWDEAVNEIETKLTKLINLLTSDSEEGEGETRHLPTSWRDVESEVVYLTAAGLRVCFGKKQIKLAKRYDFRNKHLVAIENGKVASKGEDGLVPSQESGYELKSKALSSGTGHHRFHAYYEGDVLYFPGKHTNDKY
jgi:hypothetical protein